AWSHFPGAGFFDHPPLVSVMAYGHQLFSQSLLGSRSGTILVATLTLLATIRLFRIVGIKDQRSLWIAIVCCQFNFFGLIGGFLTTPDTIFILSWVLAITESVLALDGKR